MRELNLFGIYLSPFLADLAVASVVFVPIKLVLDGIGVDRVVWHRPLFDCALFACLAAALALTGLGGRSWPA